MIRIRRSATPAARVAFALTLLATAPAVAAAQHGAHASTGKNLVEVAVGAGSFNTLVAAVKAAGLVETLQGAGPFTIFAPTDAAFAKLPAGTLDALLADKDALRKVLTYHVVPGRVVAGDIVRAKSLSPRTVNGAAIDVAVRDGKVFVNNAQVVSTDVQASNGVIHVIDTVLIPAAAPATK